MSDIWMVVSLHDNDFWVDLTFLGDVITRIMSFYDSYKLPEYVRNNDDFKSCLKSSLFSMLTSIYRLQYLLTPNNYMPDTLSNAIDIHSWLDTDNKSINDLFAYFSDRFELYYTDEDFNKFARQVNLDAMSNSWKDVKYIDEYSLCNGNYEYLIVHCSAHECKSIII